MSLRQIIRSAFEAARSKLFAPPPPEIVGALQLAQLDNVRRNVPMLLTVAAFNVIIVMAVCANSGMALVEYGWMSGLVAYCFLRIILLRKSLIKDVAADQVPKILRRTVVMSIGMLTILGAVSSLAFVTDLFSFEVMVPVSLAFGTTAIAQCLYTLRKAAVAILLLGITPVALAMVFTGSFDAQMLGVAMLSIQILMARFVLQQFDVLVERLSIEQKFKNFANTDALTEIANRRAIMGELRLLELQSETAPPFAIALLDLDEFKQINDNLGHSAGDQVLKNVALRIREAADQGDSVGRLGGDEFIVIFRDVAGASDVSARATALLGHLCQPLDLDGHVVPVGASIGYATFPGDGRTIEGLFHAADMALYSRKRGARRKRVKSPISGRDAA